MRPADCSAAFLCIAVVAEVSGAAIMGGPGPAMDDAGRSRRRQRKLGCGESSCACIGTGQRREVVGFGGTNTATQTNSDTGSQ